MPLKKTGGRNFYGRITTRHKGGGHKRMLRIVDFKRDALDTPAKVVAIEYDPIVQPELLCLNILINKSGISWHPWG